MEIQMGSSAKSYMTIASMVTNLRISSYIRKPFLIHDFALDPIWISLYMRQLFFLFYQCSAKFSFLSVYSTILIISLDFFEES